jgi:hypothetical protein
MHVCGKYTQVLWPAADTLWCYVPTSQVSAPPSLGTFQSICFRWHEDDYFYSITPCQCRHDNGVSHVTAHHATKIHIHHCSATPVHVIVMLTMQRNVHLTVPTTFTFSQSAVLCSRLTCLEAAISWDPVQTGWTKILSAFQVQKCMEKFFLIPKACCRAVQNPTNSFLRCLS